jgi:hypothetical protein
MDTLLIAALEKDNLALQTRNSFLENKIVELEKKILVLENEKSNIKLQDKYNFVEKLGISKSKETGHYFCTSCLMKNIESPLTTKQNGWQCELQGCDRFYSNPSYQPPPEEKYDPFKNL